VVHRVFYGLVALSSTDLRLLDELQIDGRISNRELARRTGLPESTCHDRLRSLYADRVLLGTRALVNPTAIGRPVQAMISVRIRPQRRKDMEQLSQIIVGLPGVIATFIVTGETDLIVHVAVPDTAALRDFVWDHLTQRPEVSDVRTALVYEYQLGPPLLPQIKSAPTPTRTIEGDNSLIH
jgi:DNA-binding Lrp family transcriptional regulator